MAAHIVLAACGHWWRESGYDDPEDGEIRVCANHVEPMRYPVVYVPNRELEPVFGSRYAAGEPETEVP